MDSNGLYNESERIFARDISISYGKSYYNSKHFKKFGIQAYVP